MVENFCRGLRSGLGGTYLPSRFPLRRLRRPTWLLKPSVSAAYCVRGTLRNCFCTTASQPPRLAAPHTWPPRHRLSPKTSYWLSFLPSAHALSCGAASGHGATGRRRARRRALPRGAHCGRGLRAPPPPAAARRSPRSTESRTGSRHAPGTRGSAGRAARGDGEAAWRRSPVSRCG